MPILHDAALVALVQRCAIGAAAAAVIAVLAYRTRALTASGAIAAIVIGSLAFGFGGLAVAAAIVIFFVSGSVLGRLHSKNADAARRLAAKDARRDAAQVVANGGVAAVCAIAYGIAALNGWHHASRLVIAAVCAIAAAAGDTWSTELGALFAGPVRRITDMRPVPAGTSGGISMLGTLAAPAGGAVVGLAGIALPDVVAWPCWLALGAIAALAGSIIDSLLGATLQAMWRCSACGQMTETKAHPACGVPATLVRGLAWLDNDGVNAAATACVGALGYAAAAMLAY
ncbi:MAG: DUF92 domain-containing protein [Candidatus Eremiobacteraeota bacterium]|nr:DUF92 domain-containing protein [Candidatus Eremiobacteraeota bacterium]